jgi:glycerol-3-phosphate dehydrogenase
MEILEKKAVKELLENEFSPRSRLINIEKLKTEELDLLIIGGGITGAGTACEASARGFKTGLVEMHDFASGTSSKSSKLLHGGLRYLEKFKIRLVFESLKDRNELFKNLPHIAKPLSFIAPVYKGNKETLFILNLGVTLYDFLSFTSGNMVTKIHKFLSFKGLKKFEPEIRNEGLKGGIQYYDGTCDDARLTIETIKTAARQGVIISNHVKVTGFEKDEKGQVKAAIATDLSTGESFKITAGKILNAAGPWVDSVNKSGDANYQNKLKPTKGIHLIVPKLTDGNAILLKTPKPPLRWVFIIPYQDYSIVGTTDTETQCEQDDYSYLDKDNYATKEEIEYLLETINYYYPTAKMTEKDIISSYGGWRPLVAPPEGENISESDISREHEIFETESGIICIAGGKLTTYMSMSKQIVDYLVKNPLFKKFQNADDKFPRLISWNREQSLEDYINQETKKYPLADRSIIRRLIDKYGTEYNKVFDIMKISPEMKSEIANLSKNARCYKAEILYSIFYEMSVSVKDFMSRRTRIILKDKQQGLGALEEIALIMSYTLADLLDWTPEYRQQWLTEQVSKYRQEVERVNSGITGK